MFESLKEFSSIVISGPQRSGTRIAAKIIAADTNKELIDERYLNNHDERLLNHYLTKENVVIQCPGLCHLLHRIKTPSTLIIVILRPIQEIISSEIRCWDKKSEFVELVKYGYTNGVISEIKYNFWKSHQKPLLSDKAKEIEYHKLSSHPLFIKDRKNFRWNQTE